MRKYDFNVRYAINLEDYDDKWWVSSKFIEVEADDIYKAMWKAKDTFLTWLKDRNPTLDKALAERKVFVDVELRI